MKDAPLRTIQPVVVPAQLYTYGTVVSAFCAAIPAFFAGIITMAVTDLPKPGLAFAAVVYVIAFASVLPLIAWRAYAGPGVTTYRIYRDRIEVEEGLLNRSRRTVLIGGVIDVRLTEGVLQRTQGAGTITLVIQPLVAGGGGRPTHQTIGLGNVPQPREVYDLIRSLAIDRRRADDRPPDRSLAGDSLD